MRADSGEDIQDSIFFSFGLSKFFVLPFLRPDERWAGWQAALMAVMGASAPPLATSRLSLMTAIQRNVCREVFECIWPTAGVLETHKK